MVRSSLRFEGYSITRGEREVNSQKSANPSGRLWGPLWVVVTGGKNGPVRMTPLFGGGQIAGDPWLVTLPAAVGSPLHDDLMRFGECTLHIASMGLPEEPLDGLERCRGYFVRSPLLPFFPLALECLLRERLTCLDRKLFIAEVAFVHSFGKSGEENLLLWNGQEARKARFAPSSPAFPLPI